MSDSIASLYPQPQQAQQAQPQNPLNQLGQITGMISQANANKAFQQEYAYKQAAGQVMQQAVDPQTGQVDFNKAALLMSTNPATAWNAPEFIKDNIANGNVQAETFNKQLAAKQTQLQAMQKAVLGVTAGGVGGTTQQAALGSVAGLIANGVVTRPQADKYLQTMAQYGDGQPLFDHLKQMAVQLQGANEAASGVIGTINNVDAGGVVKPMKYANTTGQVTPAGAPIVKTPTTAELNNPMSTPNLGTGEVTTGPAVATVPMVDGAGKPINDVGGPATTGLGPQSNQILTQYAPGLNDRVANAQTTIQGLNNMRELAAQFRSGAGATSRMKVAAGAQALGMPNWVVDSIAGKNGDSQDAAYAKMQEYYKQTVLTSMQTLRSVAGSQFSTDEYNTFKNALQSPDMDPRALSGITDYMQKLAELPGMEQQGFKKYQEAVAQGKTYTDAQGNVQKYQLKDWNSQWNKALVRSGKIKLITPGAAAGFFQAPQAQAPGSAQPGGGNGQ